MEGICIWLLNRKKQRNIEMCLMDFQGLCNEQPILADSDTREFVVVTK